MEGARGKLQRDGKCELLPASGWCDPAAEGRASVPTGNAYLTQAEFFFTSIPCIGMWKKREAQTYTSNSFLGKDKGVSGFLPLAKPESVAAMDIFVCTGLKLLCCAPEIKAAFCCVALRQCLQP